MTGTATRLLPALATALLLAAPAGFAAPTPAPLPVEQPGVAQLGAPQPHWFLVNDFNALGPMDSKVYLFDGDSGDMLGMLSTGAWQNTVETAPDFSTIYSPETYYARGTRGERTDVLTVYDTRTLAPTGEVIIPTGRASGMPQRAYSGRSDDGRFVYVANLTPATSVTVVDTQAMKVTAEIETSGCALVYATGVRQFSSLCSDGTLQTITLDAAGELAGRERSPRFFAPEDDPLTEKAARIDNTWLFVSFSGTVYPVTVTPDGTMAGKPWALFSEAEKQDGWKPGGLGFTAVHAASRRLYVVVHQGGADTHKHPGTDVWVYDIDRQRRVQTIELEAPASAIAVSRDPNPLFYTTSLETPAIMVYDGATGAFRRVIEGPPFNPTHIVVP